MSLILPRLRDLVSPLLREDRRCKPLSSLALPNRGPQIKQSRGGGGGGGGVARIESKEADPVLSSLQVIPHSDRDEGQPRRSKFTRFGLPRPPLSERIITNYYAPPCGPEPLRVEVSALGEDDISCAAGSLSTVERSWLTG